MATKKTLPAKAKSSRKLKSSAYSSNNLDGLSADEVAAIRSYENSLEGMAESAPGPDSREKKLTAIFYKTPEMQECRETADSININLNPEDAVPVQINVPREFIRLTEFLEQKRALNAGVPPLPADKVLNDILLNELHDQLHALVTGPGRFRYFRDLWNRFCDEQNATDLKLGQPDPQPSSEEF